MMINSPLEDVEAAAMQLAPSERARAQGAAVEVDICSGLQPASITEEFAIWPVPVQQIVQLLLPGSGTITIHDVQGRVVLQTRSLGNRTVLDTSALPAGIYVLRYTGNGASISRTFIKG